MPKSFDDDSTQPDKLINAESTVAEEEKQQAVKQREQERKEIIERRDARRKSMGMEFGLHPQGLQLTNSSQSQSLFCSRGYTTYMGSCRNRRGCYDIVGSNKLDSSCVSPIQHDCLVFFP